MISWIIFSCVAEYTAFPQRFAGTCRQYSKKAIPQLTKITSQIGRSLYLRWPYHAMVIKMLEQIRSPIGTMRSKRLFIIMNFLAILVQWEPEGSGRSGGYV